MLIKLLPEQISQHWDVIKDAIEYSLNPVVGESPHKMNNILMSLLDGSMQCWVAVEGDDYNKITGNIVTKINFDDASQTKGLLIYSLYAEGSSEQEWLKGYETLRKFAAANGCTRIVGFTDVPSLIKFTNRIGGEARYTLVSLPVYVGAEKEGGPDE